MSTERTSTRLHAIEDAPPAFVAALDAWRERQRPDERQIRPIDAAVRTQSVVPALSALRRLFGRRDREETVAVVSAGVLLIAAVRNGGEAQVVSIRLTDGEVTDYEQTPRYPIQPDTGLEILGVPKGGTERQHYFLGLGPEATFFRDAVRAARP